jgi:hypothetical protein
MRLPAAAGVFGIWAFPTTAGTLSPEQSVSHIGETATVCGMVVSVEYEPNEQSQPTLLDLGKPHPNAIFTAVISGIIDRNSERPKPPFGVSASV